MAQLVGAGRMMNPGGGPWWRQKLPAGAKLVDAGDSRTQGQYQSNSGGTALYSNSSGMTPVVQATRPYFKAAVFSSADSRQSRYYTGASYGISGDNIGELYTRLVTNGEAWACNPQCLLIYTPVNDFRAGLVPDGAALFVTLMQIVQAALDRHIRVILCTIPGFASSASILTTSSTPAAPFLTSDIAAQLLLLNNLIRAVSMGGVTVCDIAAAINDPAPASGIVGDPLAYTTDDGTHYDQFGVMLMEPYLNEAIEALFYPGLWFNSEASNAMPNPTFSGTGGSVNDNTLGGSSGIASSWAFQRAVTDPGTQVTVSKSSGYQVLSFANINTASANATEISTLQPSAFYIARSPFADGDCIVVGFRLDIDAWDDWRAIWATLSVVDSGGSTRKTVNGLNNSNFNANNRLWQNGAADLYVFSQPLKLISTDVNLRPRLSIRARANGGSGSGKKITLKQAWLIKVTDPEVDFPTGPT